MRVISKQFAHAYKPPLVLCSMKLKEKKKIFGKEKIQLRFKKKRKKKEKKRIIGDLPYTGCPNSKDI